MHGPVIRPDCHPVGVKLESAASVLSALLSFGLDQSDLSINVAAGLPKLHTADRADIIWEPGEIEAVCKAAGAEVARVIHLARMTALRQGDLLSLPWSADKGTHIDWMPSKSRRRARRIIVPVTPELRGILDATPKKGVQILLNTRNRPWTGDGFRTQFGRAKTEAAQKSPTLKNKTFHDLRGTAATHLALAGLDDREIAEIVGWSEKRVQDMRRRYVDREALILSSVARLKRAGSEQEGNE